MRPLLSLGKLAVNVQTSTGIRSLVEDITFSLQSGEVLALVGGSGSGKTTLCRAMTKLLPAEFTITGNVTFDSQDLLSCDPRTLQNVRRRLIRYVFQEPQQALNPSLTIRSQLSLASVVASMPEPELLQVLQSVGLTHPEEVLKSYPHQLSIGMAQRVMIAMAILPHPSLLIADEPTSALDVSQRYRLLDLLKSLQQQYSMTMILVTHDLELAGMYADYTAVLKKGRIIEHKPTGQLFQNPEHEYSRLLVRATKPLQDPLKV